MTARFCMRNKSSTAGPSPPRLGPVTDAHTTAREAKAQRMEDVIRGYFDACNTGDADAVATYFAPGAVSLLPAGHVRGTVSRWRDNRREVVLGGADAGLALDRGPGHLRPDTDRAVIEWTHEKTKAGVVLRGDEW